MFILFVSFQPFTVLAIERNVMIRPCTRLGTTITEQTCGETESLSKDGQTRWEIDRDVGYFPLFFGFQRVFGPWLHSLFIIFFTRSNNAAQWSIFDFLLYCPCVLRQWIRSLKIVIANYSCLALFPIRLQRISLLKIPTVVFAYRLAGPDGMNEFPSNSYGSAAHLFRTWFHCYAKGPMWELCNIHTVYSVVQES